MRVSIKREKRRKYETDKRRSTKSKLNCRDLLINIVEHKPVQNKQVRHLNCEGGQAGTADTRLTSMKRFRNLSLDYACWTLAVPKMKSNFHTKDKNKMLGI